jgi:transcriptional regulator with XRE-family HTH domain
MRKLGEVLQSTRLKRGLSQEQLAERSGVSVQHIAFIEQGRRKPQLKTLEKIADALGVRVKDLIPF